MSGCCLRPSAPSLQSQCHNPRPVGSRKLELHERWQIAESVFNDELSRYAKSCTSHDPLFGGSDQIERLYNEAMAA